MKLDTKRFDAVAFDFDGTLANTYPVHRKARLEAFERYGVTVPHEINEIGHTLGSNTAEITAGILKAVHQLAEDADPYTHPLVRNVVDAKREIFERLIVQEALESQPGAVEFVQAVAAYFPQKTMIVTGAVYPEVIHFVERYKLSPLFPRDRLVCEEDVKTEGVRLKPAPDSYLLAANRISVEPGKMLVIEDSVGGVASGKRAGAVVLAVGYVHAQEEFLAAPVEEQPDYFVLSLEEIVLE